MTNYALLADYQEANCSESATSCIKRGLSLDDCCEECQAARILRAVPAYEWLYKQAISRSETDGFCFGCGNYEGHDPRCPLAALKALDDTAERDDGNN